jgi:hypothetical protein
MASAGAASTYGKPGMEVWKPLIYAGRTRHDLNAPERRYHLRRSPACQTSSPLGQMTLPGMATGRTAGEQQAINDAFKNGATWAILTHFEKLRLVNARHDCLSLSPRQPRLRLSNLVPPAREGVSRFVKTHIRNIPNRLSGCE